MLLLQSGDRGRPARHEEWKSHSVLPSIPHQEMISQNSSNRNSDHSNAPLPPIENKNNGFYMDQHQQSSLSHPQLHPQSHPQSHPRHQPQQPQLQQHISGNKIKQEQPTQVISPRNKQMATKDDWSYEPNTYENHDSPREHQWKPAAGYSYLSAQPIALTKDQEIFLMRKISQDIADCSFEQIRSVYKEMAVNDHQLTGWGSYTDLGTALRKHGVSATHQSVRMNSLHSPAAVFITLCVLGSERFNNTNFSLLIIYFET